MARTALLTQTHHPSILSQSLCQILETSVPHKSKRLPTPWINGLVIVEQGLNRLLSNALKRH